MSYLSNAAMNAAQAQAHAINAGGSIGITAQASPYVASDWTPVIDRTNVTIEQVENGYIVTINNKRYICDTAESACQQILVQMVAKKMENK